MRGGIDMMSLNALKKENLARDGLIYPKCRRFFPQRYAENAVRTAAEAGFFVRGTERDCRNKSES